MAALALRQNTPDWVDMEGQIKQLQLVAELDAMEAYIDAGTPNIPIINLDAMTDLTPPSFAKSSALDAAYPHRAPSQLAADKAWKYPGYKDTRRPEDDWRNYK